MISFPAQTDIIVVRTPVSFACGIDGMCRYCRIILRREPMDSGYFLFVNRLRNQARALWYDGQGFSLYTKRLSTGIFRYWPKPGESCEALLSYFEAQSLLVGGDIETLKANPIWKKVG